MIHSEIGKLAVALYDALNLKCDFQISRLTLCEMMAVAALAELIAQENERDENRESRKPQ